MTFRCTELIMPIKACGWTVPADTELMTEDARGFHDDRRKQFEKRMALLKAELRKATAVH